MLDDKWVARFLDLAYTIAGWSKDPSTRVGAVAVSPEGRILATGWNGFPRGIEDSNARLGDRAEKYKYVVHAEMNCIYNSSYTGTSLRGSSLFVSGLPVCSECAKGAIQAGISSVYMCYGERGPTLGAWAQSFDLSREMFDEAGVSWKVV
jgi:dCMP deaminase